MRKISTLILLIISLTLAGTGVQATSPSQGVYNEKNELLSNITNFAGSGSFGLESGSVEIAAFRAPSGLALLPDGSVLVTDTRNHLIRKIKGGQVTTYAGFEFLPTDSYSFPTGALLDGKKDQSVFHRPEGLAVDTEGNVYVADRDNHAIRKISTGGQVTTVAGDGVQGNSDGKEKKARFDHPSDIAIATDGTMYVTDTGNHVIRKITKDGTVTTLNASSDRIVELVSGVVTTAGDYRDGALQQALFNEPSGIVLDAKGNLYVSDTGNQLIRYIDLEEKRVKTVAGYIAEGGITYSEQALYARGGFVDGKATEAKFSAPRGLALTEEGGVVIADSLNHAIRYLHNGIVTTLAGANGKAGNKNGLNGKNEFYFPTDVVVAKDGSIYIADTYNNKVKVWTMYSLPPLPTNNEVKVVYDQKQIVFDAKPEVINGRTMIPVRAIAEAFGYKVHLTNSTVELSKDNKSVQLQSGSNNMKVIQNSQEPISKALDVAPYVKEGRLYVPLRFFSEAFDIDVQWYGENQTVILRKRQ